MPPILKPSSCTNCPFYTLSNYITPDYIVPESSVLILAQNPGEYEESGRKIEKSYYSQGRKVEECSSIVPQPLIGLSGQWLQREFWPLTQLDYTKVSRANVIKCRPYNSNELPSVGSNKPVNGISVKMLKEAIQYCTHTHLKIPSTTQYILAMGGISLYSLTGQESITDWRGWCIGRESIQSTSAQSSTGIKPTLYGITDYYNPLESKATKIFPTLHIASLPKQPKLYHATLYDFIRFGRLVRGEWPTTLPEIKINYVPSSIPNYIGFDTEYDPTDNNRLEMWSLADIAGNIYVVDSHITSELYNIPSSLTLITQNGLVDLPHFIPMVRDTDLSTITMEDCMLAHSTLWTGEPNSLDYMLSKYGRYNRHKHLRTTTDSNLKYLYAGLDADTTLNHVWRALLSEFKKDSLSWNEYKLRRQPLLHIISRFQSKGVQVWQERVQRIADLLDKEMASIIERAKLVTNNPHFNIASHTQLSHALYDNDMFSDPKTIKQRRRVTKPIEKAKRTSSKKATKKRAVGQAKVDALIEQTKLLLAME